MPHLTARVFWLFGLPGSGKTTLARELRDRLSAEGRGALVLDDDELRPGFSGEAGAPEAEADGEVRLAARLARTLSGQGSIVIVALVTEKEQHRLLAREILGDALILIYLDCGREAREKRKGRLAEDQGFEPPNETTFSIATDKLAVGEAALSILNFRGGTVAGAGDGSRKNADQGIRRISAEKEPVGVAASRTTAPDDGISDVQPAERQPLGSALTPRSGPWRGGFEGVGSMDRSQRAGSPKGLETDGGSAEKDDAADPGLRRILPAVTVIGAAAPTGPETSLTEGKRPLSGRVPGIPAFPVIPDVPAEADQRSSRRSRHRRFAAKRGFFGSPFLVFIVTIGLGAFMGWFLWLIHLSAEKKDAVARFLSGDPGGTEGLVRTDSAAAQPQASAERRGSDADKQPRKQTAAILVPSQKFTTYEPPDAEAVRQRALADMDQYFKARTWREKSIFVREPYRVSPLMEAAYSKQGRMDAAPGKVSTTVFQRAGALEILMLIYAPVDANSSPEKLFLVKQQDKTWKLDWESYFGSSAIGWEEFMQSRTIQPTLLRARAQAGNRFGGEYSDSSRYFCVRLEEPRLRGHVIYAYSENGSKQAQTMKQLFKSNETPAVSVRVAYPTAAQSNDRVRFLELVTEGWLLLD